jgi:hypothetical protein
MYAPLFGTVIDDDVETATRRKNQLLQVFVRMTAPCLPARHIKQIVHAGYGKRNLSQIVYSGDASSGIVDTRKVKQPAVMYAIAVHGRVA